MPASHRWTDVPPHEDVPTFVHHDGPPDDAGVPAQLDQVVLDAHLGLHQLPELDVAEVPDMAVLSITVFNYLHLVPPPRAQTHLVVRSPVVPAEGVVVAPGPGAVVRQVTQLVNVETVQTRTQVEQLPGYSVKVNNSPAIHEPLSRDVGSPLRVQQPDLPLHVHGALPPEHTPRLLGPAEAQRDGHQDRQQYRRHVDLRN